MSYGFKRASRVLVNNGGCLYDQKYSLVLQINPKISPLKRFNSTKAEPEGTSYKNLTIGVPKESFLNERRVAITPAVTQTLVKKGFKVIVEENAGALAQFPNIQYEASGAMVTQSNNLYSSSDILLKVRPPTIEVRF